MSIFWLPLKCFFGHMRFEPYQSVVAIDYSLLVQHLQHKWDIPAPWGLFRRVGPLFHSRIPNGGPSLDLKVFQVKRGFEEDKEAQCEQRVSSHSHLHARVSVSSRMKAVPFDKVTK